MKKCKLWVKFKGGNNVKKIAKMLLVSLLALGLMVAVTGCGGGEPKASKPAEKAAENKPAEPAKKKLVIASDTAYAPFEFQDEKTGQYVGFDMDLIKAVAEVAGFEVEIKSMGFDGVIQAVASKQVDGAISAMTITPERSKMFNFSAPYFDANQSIAVKANNDSIKSEADLKGKKIAVQIGTTGADYAKKIKGTKVKDFNTIDLAFMELKNGNADAVVNDFPVTAYFIQKGNSDVKVVSEIQTGEQYGIAFNKDNTEVLEKVNAALKTLKENGKYDEIYKQWFGTTPNK